MFRVFSMAGQLEFETYADQGSEESYISAIPIGEFNAAVDAYFGNSKPKQALKWGWKYWKSGRVSVYMPHWFAILVTGVIGALFTIRSPLRFGLRTLLLVTALVAILLGIVAILR